MRFSPADAVATPASITNAAGLLRETPLRPGHPPIEQVGHRSGSDGPIAFFQDRVDKRLQCADTGHMGTLIHQPGLTFLVSQTAEYALRSVVYLAQRPDGPSTAQDIAEGTKVPLGYLQKILRMLARDGLLTAQRGIGGGFALAKVPTAISVLDVLKAADANVNRIDRCPLGIKGHTRLCALHQLLDQEIAHAEHTFATTSLADLLASNGDVRPLCSTKAATPLTIEARGGRKASRPADNTEAPGD